MNIEKFEVLEELAVFYSTAIGVFRLCLVLNEGKSRPRLDLRFWFCGADGTLVPSRNGVGILDNNVQPMIDALTKYASRIEQ